MAALGNLKTRLDRFKNNYLKLKTIENYKVYIINHTLKTIIYNGNS